ncbi:protein FAR1-RELATED SEQUENCE 5-like [Bidens hawaiensis]|uniref:protein FAR1-RELATED SEQUENCE 5-like n=1 Tax=Bidens hawaiensis TaxID=980011 RepID=UPI00404A7CFF
MLQNMSVLILDDSSVLVEGQGVDIIPEVASSYRPIKGMMFSSIDQAFYFYSEYAKKARFGVSKGGSYIHDGVIKTKMVADSDMQFVRSARKLTHVQEEAIYELSNMNLGPVKAFNLMRTQYGGFEKVGATKDDCKNFKQGLNCYIGEYDAEIIVQRLCAKGTFSSDYSLEYDVNDDRELIRVFWADEISKSNNLAFGDIISFDATFKTKKYKMVFVLITEIDNHCHSVTVGAGLLASKTIESYTWLLQMLLKSFGSAPKAVVTNQDPAMKQAIAYVFPNTRHRLCMCYIMKKIADKVTFNCV